MLTDDRLFMATPAVERQIYLDAFMAAGIVGSLQGLIAMSESEFQGCLTALQGGTDAGESRTGGPAQPSAVELRKQTVDERIQALKRPKDSISLTEAVESGRRIGRAFLESYGTDVKPRVINSGLSALH
jgi:hypothetical protein